jgi:hypothetical protein
MEIGSRVYHEGIRANGIVIDIDENMKKDKLKVEFLWAKYCEVPHGKWGGYRSTVRKWVMTREDSLVETDMTPGPNKVTLVGRRSLEKLIRTVAEVDQRKPRDGSDIVINYGGGVSNVPDSIFKINANPIWNKYDQCRIMGETLAPEVFTHISNCPELLQENLIVKPKQSIGGMGIYDYTGQDITHQEYLQVKFDKVREFRVHVFLWMDNPVPFIQEKVIKDHDQLCWNKKQGGKFRYVYQDGLTEGKYMDELSVDLRNKLSTAALSACKKLEYDFGGVDIGVDANGNVKIFEVNSRMGLREQSLFTYKRAIQALRHLDIQTYREERFNV